MKRFILFLFTVIIGLSLYVGYKTFFVIPEPAVKPQQLQPSRFSMERAPENSLRGTMQNLTGNVAIQSRIATEPARIIAPVPVQQGELIATRGDGKVTIILGESTMHLSPNSSIELIQTLPTAMVYRQYDGTISYENPSSMPISVRSMRLLTKINTGTATVSADLEEETVTVAVASGSVTVGFNDEDLITNLVSVNAGNQYVFDNQNKEGTVRPIKR